MPETRLAPGATVADRYTVTGEIGRGGMAVVHRARDTRHGRDVALKVMLPTVTEKVGAERFFREIETVARLQHPHIVPVFDSGSAEGHLYFVMPLIEGETLRHLLERQGRLAVEEALRLVREVADALDYAHGEGVVHRDLKPENILISRGHALLTDFGIAQVRRGPDETALTRVGTTLGTAAYMSPELASGEAQVTSSSDVYALGCILFELLTGRAVFTGDSYQAVLIKRFTTDAPRIRSLRPDVPRSCDDAVARALEREPGDRFASARAFSEALSTDGKAQEASRESAGGRSVVVLPFDNLSPNPDDAYLADGLTEELTADLARVQGLRVIARNSAAAARQQTGDLKAIAQMLDVRYLLEGSVRRAGSQLRITAQLIDGTTDAHLWAEKYGGTMDDVFEMQERISGSIVRGLKARLTTDEVADRGAGAAVTDTETYELYLRARHMLGQSLLRLPEAAPLLEEAIERDPGFAPAYCVLGSPLVVCAFFGYLEPTSAWARIQSLADRALAVDPRSGPAHALLAAVATYRDWDWAEGRRLYDRAAELEPGANFDHFMYAFFLAFGGDLGSGLRAAREGRRLDPLGFIGLLTEAGLLTYGGEYEAALPLAERPIAFDPQFPDGHHIAGYIELSRGNHERAIEHLDRAIELSHRASWPVAKKGCSLVALGRIDEARELLAELEQRSLTDPTICAPAVATLHLHLGDRDEFYRWMHRALDHRDPYALSLRVENLWERARKEPRFQELLDRVGLSASRGAEALATI